MLKIGLIFVVLTLLTNSLFFSGPIVISSESNNLLKIQNKTANFLQYVICRNQSRVGDRLLSSNIEPEQTIQIETKYLNSSVEEKNITVYIISSDKFANSTLIEKKFDNSCNFDSPFIAYIDLTISKNSNISLLLEGNTVSNGLGKIIPSLTIDNTAHLVGMDFSSFYFFKNQQTKLKSKIFTPSSTGLVYKTETKEQNEICLDKKSAKLQLISHEYDNKTIYLGFVPLNEGTYTIAAKSEAGCNFTNPDLTDTITVYENQYVIVTGASTINPLYKESGITIINSVDKKIK
ncbi:MAG: hypothetical protein H7196_05175 [candidate division SR1 bacterium]|nr:hypothetical protein [candidate division SR1 bacterium]